MAAAQAESITEKDMHFLSYPFQLQKEVEMLQGANNQTMLFHSTSGKYILIPELGVKILRMLDGKMTGQDVVHVLESEYPNHSSIQILVYRFFRDLQRSGVLNIEPEEEHGFDSVIHKVSHRPILKLPLVRTIEAVTVFITRMISFVPKPAARILLTGISMGAIFLFLWSGNIFGFFPNLAQVVWGFVVPVILIHLIFHELAHAVVSQYFGVRIREAGIGLLYYFIPIAYVDRTDTYRLQNKFHRMYISLAGPFFDLSAAGVWAAIALVLGETRWGETASLISFLGIMLMIGNLNLLLPTDGYHALEAATGEMVLRRRAFLYVFYRMMRRPLPSYLQNVRSPRSMIYMIYTMLSFLYMCLLFVVIGFVAYTLF